MRISLDASLSEPLALDTLATIVRAIGAGWHEWIGPDPDKPELGQYFALHPVHHEFVIKSYTRALLYPLDSKRTVIVVEDEDAPYIAAKLDAETTLSLERASIVLTAPLPVLVENEINDGAFFLRFIRIVDPALVDLFRESNPPIRFDHAGGKAEALKLISHRAREAHDRGLPVRLLVLLDSDAKWPGHQSGETGRLRTKCSDTGASIHILAKRSIENYVPDRVLLDYAAERPDVAPSVTFLLSLPPNVRDHYPIKDGIRSINGKADLPKGPEKSLYSTVSFPQGYRPKLKGLSDYCRASDIDLETSDLQARGCLDEIHHITRWIREEL